MFIYYQKIQNVKFKQIICIHPVTPFSAHSAENFTNNGLFIFNRSQYLFECPINLHLSHFPKNGFGAPSKISRDCASNCCVDILEPLFTN